MGGMKVAQVKMICGRSCGFTDAQLERIIQITGSVDGAINAVLGGSAKALLSSSVDEQEPDVIEIDMTEDSPERPKPLRQPTTQSFHEISREISRKPLNMLTGNAVEIVELLEDSDTASQEDDSDHEIPVIASSNILLPRSQNSSKPSLINSSSSSSMPETDLKHQVKIKSGTRRMFANEEPPPQPQPDKRELAKLKKAQAKALADERAALRGVNKIVVDKREALKEMYMELDVGLGETIIQKIMAITQENSISTSVKSMKLPWTVMWKRKCKKTWDMDKQTFVPTAKSYMYEENIIVKILSATSCVAMIKANCFVNDVKVIRASYPDKRIVYLIYGLPGYYHKLRTAVNRSFQGKTSQVVSEPGKAEIEMAILKLQCSRLCHVTVLEKDEYIEEWLLSYSREVAIGPHEKVRYENNMTFAISDIGPCGKTMSEHWAKMLEQINGITPPIANAILKKYPTINSLWSACSNVQENTRQAIALLADIPLSSSRRLGPNLAEKIFKMMISNNANLLLQQLQQ